ncbi:protoporphyrinogen oxidase [Alicyclobacillus cycloheptanicus]|uniref:Coproporphyrinogen III oxidase n=1 Tax=Alicyclobacillus cycloheptanicus TaxID=1457 RepID=A0ABT9XEZ8_9BACL|nr:protoporphyrinogen oxidase [Alicyclobacillus cycloheptanicus]MDQ0188705.1 oxygen-dependent protoporphyrinogen oxidase [Alicyclobacillus cycloheptanicus]WDM00626.1 protoporphyrinogen oxidase [Alicyclobacillus cycloheptanicus]
MRERHIVVIGGGITGLSAAFELKRKAEAVNMPVRCTVIEKDSRFGGKIQTKRRDGFVLERGPDSMLARKPAGVNLIRDLGIESETVGTNPHANKTYILHEGQLEPMPKGHQMGIPVDFTSFLQTRLLTQADKLRVVLEPFIPRGSADGDESLGQLLRRRFGDALVNRLLEPLMAGIYAGSIDHLSVRTTFPQYQKLEQQYRSLVLGLRAQRRAMAAMQAPGAERVGPASGRSVFITLRDGLQTLVERLYDTLVNWADLRVSTDVTGVTRRTDGTYTVTVHSEGQVEHLPADAVICTTPAGPAAQLLSDLVPAAARLSEIPYVSTATIVLAYPEEKVQVDLDASGFLVPRGEQRAITASTWVSSKWPNAAPKGHVAIRCYVGRAGQEEGLKLDDADLVDVVRQELKSILGLDAKPEFTVVSRWNNAMPQYTVHHLDRMAEVEAAIARQAPGLYIAGAGYYAIGIPDCIKHGQEAAARALAHVTDGELAQA